MQTIEIENIITIKINIIKYIKSNCQRFFFTEEDNLVVQFRNRLNLIKNSTHKRNILNNTN
jgi:hypothetical protein